MSTKEQVASYLKNTCMAQGHQSRLSGDVVVITGATGGGGSTVIVGREPHFTLLLYCFEETP